jgi:transposase
MSRREAASYRRVSVSTVQYWIDRYRSAGDAERRDGSWAQDRPSTPHRQPGRVSEQMHDRVCEARERTDWGPRLLASELGLAHATVSRCLQRRGLSRLPKEPRDPVRRFEWPCPGDLLQMDTKRLARFTRPGHKVTGDRYRTSAERNAGVGWEFCHSIIDDHSRLAYTEIHADEQAATVTGFVERALAFFAGHGITAHRLQTDNAWAYIHNRSLRELLTARGIQHRRIVPRRRGTWARGLDRERVWALEDCRHVSGGLERFLIARGERVVRVSTRLMAGSRRSSRARGKSDRIDAISVARAALAVDLQTLPTAALAGPELDLRLLVDHRERLVRVRVALNSTLQCNLHGLWPELG